MTELPQLLFHRALSSEPAQRRSTRGFDEACWTDLDAIARLARFAGLRGKRLTHRLLNVGPCPGLWRTYYTATGAHVSASAFPAVALDGNGNFLGRSPTSATVDALGKEFEGWVDEANLAAGRFAAGNGTTLADLNSIQTPALRDFYRRRTSELAEQVEAADLPALEMRVPGGLVAFENLPLTNPTPDGVFDRTSNGGIFESKLCDPKGEPLFFASMAAYALAAEKQLNRPFDIGVLLHSGYPSSSLGGYHFYIDESAVSQVRRNLQRLRSLVEVSWSSWTRSHRAGAKPHSWDDLLRVQKPPASLRPPGDRFAPCSSCRFKPRCWGDNGWV
ncbi:MAG: hypothetical protein ACHQ2Y_00375 [Candidatus Lutacidiplasmatales archaeon]